MVKLLNIIKRPYVSALPKSLHQTNWSGPPCFFLLFPHKRVMSTQQVPSNRRMHNLLHPKKRENEMPHHSCFGAMKEQVVCRFLRTFAQVTPTRERPSPSFELVDSKDSSPRCFPSKKVGLQRCPSLPYNAS